MDESARDIGHWNDFYRTHDFARESTFARFVDSHFGRPLAIVELGCGDGRDAAFFYRRGHVVRAADRSVAGIARARGKISAPDGRLSFVVADAADRAELEDLLGAPLAGNAADMVVYARFFLHAVPLDVEEQIFDVAARTLPPGGFLAAEFRTDRDADLPKAEGIHYRRFIAPAEMASRLRDRGFEIVHEEAGFGLSVYRDEDPHLARIIARKSP